MLGLGRIATAFLVFVAFPVFVYGKTEVPDDAVLSDNGVSMTAREFEQVVKYWSPQMRKDAADRLDDRFELISMSMATKRLAEEAKLLTPEADGDWYWKKEFLLRNLLRKFMVDRYVSSIVPPDMNALARERYEVTKDEVAVDPERRLSSHILLMCQLGSTCNRDLRREEAQKILQELKDGADFEVMVREHSEGEASRAKKGLFDRWLARDEPHVSGAYLMGVFDIDRPGGYSEVVESRYGFHVIRLDEIRKPRKLTFDEVKEDLILGLENDYKKQKAMEFDRRYRFSDDGFIDGKAMEEIFAPYKTEEAEPEPKKKFGTKEKAKTDPKPEQQPVVRPAID